MATTSMLNCPPNCTPCALSSNLEVKQWWLYNEWNGNNESWKKMIQNEFPNRVDLRPNCANPQIEKIAKLFDKVRGNYALWGPEKENAKWTKLEVTALDPEWVKKNIKVTYPKEVKFEVSELKGLVLWKSSGGTPYQLLEGNHRISAWLASTTPQPIASTMFIGESPS